MATDIQTTICEARNPDAIRLENMGGGFFVLCQWDELSQTEHRVVVSAGMHRGLLEAILS